MLRRGAGEVFHGEVLGLALVAAPVLVGDAVRPWKLTLLTGRMAGAWLVAWGVVLVQVAVESEWRRVRPGLVGVVALGVLQLIVLVRFGSELSWNDLRTWAFAAVTIALMALAAIGLSRHGIGR